MMGLKLGLAVVFLLFLFGCSDSSGPARENEAGNPAAIVVYTHEDAQAADEVPIPRDAADSLIKEFAGALNAGDAAKVLDVMTWRNDGYYTVEWAKAALDNYGVYFNGGKIEKAAFLGPAEFHQGLIYRLYTPDGNYKEVYVNAGWLDAQPLYNELFIYDNILHYSYRANGHLDVFVNALRGNRPEKIASLLTYDDYASPYPESKAAEAIGNYGQLFDLQTVRYAFIGTETKKADSRLLYELQGTKSNTPVKHSIKVSYGDGLVGIRDDLIPPK